MPSSTATPKTANPKIALPKAAPPKAAATSALDASLDQVLDRVRDDPKSVLRLRVLRAARLLIAQHGLGVSMDDVADAAGVGRRTLFRHFESRDALVADAVSSSFDWYDERVDAATRSDVALEPWLSDLISRLHALHRSAGRGLWQLAAADDADLAPELAAVNQRRRRRRRATTKAIAGELWRRSGGSGATPPALVDACALTISSFASHSMLDDFGRDLESLVRSSTSMLVAFARSELAAQQRAARTTRKA